MNNWILKYLFALILGSGLTQCIAESKSVSMSLENVYEQLKSVAVGQGRLAVIISIGSNRPGSEKTVLIDRKNTNFLDIVRATRVRWLSTTELVIQHSQKLANDQLSNRVLELRDDGQIRQVLTEAPYQLSAPEPAPAGRWITLLRYKGGSSLGLEIRDIRNTFDLNMFVPNKPNTGINQITHAVWSPDTDKLALGLLVQEGDRLSTRLGYMLRNSPDIYQVLDKKPINAVPLFWNAEGIYATTNDGVILCNPSGSNSECTPIYSPGSGKYVYSGRMMGDNRALLLVQDHTKDPFEIRAKEIHKLDLTTKKAVATLKLPDGVFISDIDWIEN